MKTLKQQLKYDKIKMNWNKNPIKVDLLLSFLTVETEISRNHLGSDNGWSQRYNNEVGLIISGGWVNGINYLDSLQYGKNLDNPYNNYVNPFHLFDIMTQEGINYFLEYYKEEIDKIMNDKINAIKWTEEKVISEKQHLESMKNELTQFAS